MKEKLYCRTCKRLTNHRMIHEVRTNGEIDEGYIQWMQTFSIVCCQGCDTIAFLEVYGDSDMVEQVDDGKFEYYVNKTIYPTCLIDVSELGSLHYVPIQIGKIYRETISAYKANCLILSAGGLRAIIEAICNHLDIDKGNLGVRIDQLHNKGHLSLNESNRLHSIRFLGNDALHEIKDPTKESLIVLFEIVNHLLENLFISDNKIKGKVETVIGKYDEFVSLLMKKINKDFVGKSFSLQEILGDSIRLIPSKKFQEFQISLRDDIKKHKIDFFTLEIEKGHTKYKIIKVPEFLFDW
jgi:hypothetical protein